MKHLEKDYKQQKPSGGVQVNTGSGNEYIYLFCHYLFYGIKNYFLKK